MGSRILSNIAEEDKEAENLDEQGDEDVIIKEAAETVVKMDTFKPESLPNDGTMDIWYLLNVLFSDVNYM